MIVEILPTGGVLIRAAPNQLRKLRDNIELALVHGRSRAPFVTEEAAAQFVIVRDGSPGSVSRPHTDIAA